MRHNMSLQEVQDALSRAGDNIPLSQIVLEQREPHP